MTYVYSPIASGTTNLGNASVQQSLYAHEAAQPEGTRMQMQVTFDPLHIPVLNQTVDVARVVSSMVNSATAAGQKLAGISTWPGESAIATYDSASRTITLKWLKESPWVGIVASFLVGITVFAIVQGWLEILGLVGTAIAAAAGLAAGYWSGQIVDDLVAAWQFVSATVQQTFGALTPAGANPALFWGGIGLAGFGFMILLGEAERHRN